MHPDTDIRRLPLRTRLINALLNARVTTYGQLRSMSNEELLVIRNVGRTLLDEIALLVRAIEDAAQCAGNTPTIPGGADSAPTPTLRWARLVLDVVAKERGEPPMKVLESARYEEEKLRPSASEDEALLFIGRRLEDLLATPVLTAVIEWGLPESGVVDHIRNELALLSRMRSGSRVSLSEELLPIVAQLSHGVERDARLATRRFGLDGEPPATLDTLGATCVPPITRERVRQITARFAGRAETARPPLPIAEAAWRILEASKRPLAEQEWVSLIPERFRPVNPSSLRLFRQLASFGWTPTASWRHTAVATFVAAGSDRDGDIQTYAEGLHRSLGGLNRTLRECGAAKLPFDNDSSALSTQTLRAVALSSLRLEAHADGWVLLRKCGSTRVAQRAARTIEVLGALPLEVLRRGLRRCVLPGKDRRRLAVPPSQVLADVLGRAGFLVSADTGMVSLSPEPRRGHPLPAAEAALVDALHTDPPVKTRHELVEAVTRMGMSDAIAVFYLGSSPLVERVGPGLYSLRGRCILPVDCEAARTRLERQHATSLLDVRFCTDGTIRLIYSVDAARGIGMFAVRASTVPEGRWSLVRSGAPPMALLVQNNYISGLSGAVRPLAKRGVRYVEVCFDVASREASLTPLSTNSD